MLNRFLFCTLLILSAASHFADADQTFYGCPAVKQHRSQKMPSCEDVSKAECEAKQGEADLRAGLVLEASRHCIAALAASSSSIGANLCAAHVMEDRRKIIRERIDTIKSLSDQGAIPAADAQFKQLQDFEKIGSVDSKDEAELDQAELTIEKARQRILPPRIVRWFGLQHWLPGVRTNTLRVLAYFAVVGMLWLVAIFFRWLLLRWKFLRFDQGDVNMNWTVSPVSDKTGQSAAGAVMDALNYSSNPLFQPLNTSSFLAVPPGLLKPADAIYPSYNVWRDFLIEERADGVKAVRVYLSELIEYIDDREFRRHRFKQVTAFEGINVKMGPVEASLGAILSALLSWWTSGWPTVTGSVVKEKVEAKSFASIRLIANYKIRRHRRPQDEKKIEEEIEKEIEENLRNGLVDERLNALKRRMRFSGDRTLAVFASTEIDEYTDAVALASQRAAFRLLYRLVKDPADTNLAIVASSYRQGVRLLMSVL